MHPLLAAQATVASLQALLFRQCSTSPDDRLVIDAITALHHWAVPDRSPVPTRLRLRRSIPLRMRIKSPSPDTLIVNRGKRRKARPGRGIWSARADREIRVVQGAGRSQKGKPNPATSSTIEDASQTRSASSLDSQAINLSDLSTEPPEGQSKLAEPSPHALEHESEILESPKPLNEDDNHSGIYLPADRPEKVDDAQFPVVNGQRTEDGSKEDPQHRQTDAESSTIHVAKRRRVSRRTRGKVEAMEQEKPDREFTAASPKSARGSDSLAGLTNMSEEGRAREFCKHRASVHKKSEKKRKCTFPKRRRPSSPDKSPGPPSIPAGAKELSGEASGFLDSPPPPFDAQSPERTRSAKYTQTDGNTEIPAISETQKSNEQDTGNCSDKTIGPTDSLGSVVVGSTSYDGRSVDMGFERTSAKQDDVRSNPSSVVWNGSSAESVIESPTGDPSVSLLDRIEETDKMSQPEQQQSPKLSHPSQSPKDQDKPNAKQDVEEKAFPVDKCVLSAALRPPTMRRKSPDKAVLSNSKSISTTPSRPQPAKSGNPLHIPVSTPLTSGQSTSVIDRTSSVRFLPSRTSPVSPDELPADSAKQGGRKQQAASSPTSEATIDEMVVCISGFTKDTESELAHELVMRLGGEIVSDLEGTQPECVVAAVDPATKETLSSETVILFALASRIPIVSLRWLTQCFSSGCWVGLKEFETPSSRLRPNLGVFTGVAAAFEDGVSRKNRKKQRREYLDDINKLITLAGGRVVENSKIVGVVRNDKSIRLHIQIAYDFDNGTLNTAPQEIPGGRIPLRVVNRSWISACLFSGQCPPP